MKINVILVFFILIGFSACEQEKKQELKHENDFIKILFTTGIVSITLENGETRKPIANEVVYGAKHLKTGKASVAIIQVSSHSVIRLQEESQLDFTVLSNNYNFSVQNGNAFFKINSLKTGTNYQIKSLAIVVGVRGTLLSVSRQEKSARVSLKEGKIGVSLEKGFSDQQGTSKEIVLDSPKALNFHIIPGETNKITIEESKITEEENIYFENIKKIEPIDNEPEMNKKLEINEKKLNQSLDQLKSNQGKKENPKKKLSFQEIKQKNKTVNEFTLFSGKIIKGAILKTDDEKYIVLTESGEVSILKSQIKSMKVF